MLQMRAQDLEGGPDSWDGKIQRNLAEVTRIHEERDRESMSKLQRLQRRNDQLKSNLRVLVSEYRNLRNQIESGSQQSHMAKVRHEDDLLGKSVEHILMEEDVRNP
jgi:flagellar biosynthesis chaperone FliJ